jgi:P-type E1-E2 ATPase
MGIGGSFPRECSFQAIKFMSEWDIVPADCTILDGAVEVDQSALTGESAAVTRSNGETIFSGSSVRRGEARGVNALGG